MDADAKLGAALRRQAGVALDHAVLYLDGAANGVNHAADLKDGTIAGALDHPPIMDGDYRVDQITNEAPAAVQGCDPRRSQQACCTRPHPTPELPRVFSATASLLAGVRLAHRRVQVKTGFTQSLSHCAHTILTRRAKR
jgi:hypothetical protein